MTTKGRPTDYTPELAAEICSQLSEGKSLRTVCLAEDMPDKSTIFRWLSDNNKEDWASGFRDQYARAKQEAADAKYEDLEEVADDAILAAYRADPKAANAVVQAHKLKADNLKWQMSKMKPKKYGEKLDLTSDGKRIEQTPVIISEIKSRNAEPKPETATSS